MNIERNTMNTAETVAKALLDIKAVGFSFEKLITFKSGILSPVYVDNRRFPYHPKEWKQVIKGFVSLLDEKNIQFDVIAGIETAGIPHSASLGYELGQPSVFIRKAAKDHGTKKMVEGGEVQGKKVLLIEDHVTTGGSSLHGVHELRNAGATVTDCLAITSYDFPESLKEFQEAGITLHTLSTFPIILKLAQEQGSIDEKERALVTEWLSDPWGWTEKHK